MTIEKWLNFAEKKLKAAGIKSSKLDAELILSRVLEVERTFLITHNERKIRKTKEFHANNWLKKRVKRIPLAYIFNEKEFFGRNFKISKKVLVPRPETETIIELYKQIAQPSDFILEVGTGSGVIAITLKLENPSAKVIASDISNDALEIAKDNSKKFKTKEINFYQSNLLNEIPQDILRKTTVLIANLPYVDKEWIDFSKPNELHFEPQIALYAENNGLKLIEKLLLNEVKKAPNIHSILLEADPEQFEKIKEISKKIGFSKIITKGYTILIQK